MKLGEIFICLSPPRYSSLRVFDGSRVGEVEEDGNKFVSLVRIRVWLGVAAPKVEECTGAVEIEMVSGLVSIGWTPGDVMEEDMMKQDQARFGSRIKSDLIFQKKRLTTFLKGISLRPGRQRLPSGERYEDR